MQDRELSVARNSSFNTVHYRSRVQWELQAQPLPLSDRAEETVDGAPARTGVEQHIHILLAAMTAKEPKAKPQSEPASFKLDHQALSDALKEEQEERKAKAEPEPKAEPEQQVLRWR